MIYITSFKPVLLVMGAFAAFVALAAILPPSVMKETMDALRFTSAVTVLYLWVPETLKSVKADPKSAESQLMVGICMFWATLVFQSVYIFLNRWLGQPTIFVDLDVVSFIPFLFTLSAFHFLTSPGLDNGRVLPRNWKLVFSALGLGIFVAGLLIGWTLSGNLAEP